MHTGRMTRHAAPQRRIDEPGSTPPAGDPDPITPPGPAGDPPDRGPPERDPPSRRSPPIDDPDPRPDDNDPSRAPHRDPGIET